MVLYEQCSAYKKIYANNRKSLEFSGIFQKTLPKAKALLAGKSVANTKQTASTIITDTSRILPALSAGKYDMHRQFPMG